MANFNELKAILQKHIDAAIDEMGINENWSEIGWVGDNVQSLMTEAAWQVVLAGKDVNDYLQKAGLLKEE